MVPKYPLERGEGDKAGEAIDVEQAFDFCHADIVTEFRSIAISIPPDFFQGIRALLVGLKLRCGIVQGLARNYPGAGQFFGAVES